MANLTPIDKSVLFEIAEEIEQAKESNDFAWYLDWCIHLSNKIQDENLKLKILGICLQDNNTATDQQCIEQLETFISTL